MWKNSCNASFSAKIKLENLMRINTYIGVDEIKKGQDRHPAPLKSNIL
jgi:hypothetical protein